MIFFTSDTHFGHANILKYDRRPFATIECHDEALIHNWNMAVGKGDVVYHLGDVAWHTKDEKIDHILNSLNGTLILVQGNHDLSNKKVLYHPRWAKVTPYQEVKFEGQKICLFHYRMTVWNRMHHGSWALHGHSHGTLPVNLNARTLDVGTMLWNYTPASFDQIAAVMQNHTFVPVDGHGTGQMED